MKNYEKIMINSFVDYVEIQEKERERKRRRGGEKAEPFTNSQHLHLSAGVGKDSFSWYSS